MKLRASLLAAVLAVPSFIYNQAYATDLDNTSVSDLPTYESTDGLFMTNGAVLQNIDEVNISGTKSMTLKVWNLNREETEENMQVGLYVDEDSKIENVKEITVTGGAIWMGHEHADGDPMHSCDIGLKNVALKAIDGKMVLWGGISQEGVSLTTEASDADAAQKIYDSNTWLDVRKHDTRYDISIRDDIQKPTIINSAGWINACQTDLSMADGQTTLSRQIWTAKGSIWFCYWANNVIHIDNSTYVTDAEINAGCILTLTDCTGTEVQTDDGESINAVYARQGVRAQSLTLNNTNIYSEGKAYIFGSTTEAGVLTINTGCSAEFGYFHQAEHENRTLEVYVTGEDSRLTAHDSNELIGFMKVTDGGSVTNSKITMTGDIEVDESSRIKKASLTSTTGTVHREGSLDTDGNSLISVTKEALLDKEISGSGNTIYSGTSTVVRTDGDKGVSISGQNNAALAQGTVTVEGDVQGQGIRSSPTATESAPTMLPSPSKEPSMPKAQW